MPHTKLITYLDECNITYSLAEHANFTVAEGKEIERGTIGAHSKNLFVRDKKKTCYYLISVLNHKRVDLKAVAQILGTTKLSFASSDDLFDMLGVVPGSVTPFGLINDLSKQVSFILDDEFCSMSCVTFIHSAMI